MPFVFASQTACAKTHIAETLSDRCTIYTPPGSVDGEEPISLYPENWTTIDSDIPCRLTMPGGLGRGMERMAAAGVQARHMFAIHLSLEEAEDLVINKTSRIRITTKGNRDFEVIGVPDVTGPRLTRVIEVQEVT